MQSPYKFIVAPLGAKFNTSKLVGGNPLYLTASIENATYVNRLAVVENIPKDYNGSIDKGDIVVIHHNVFRDYYNHEGKVSNSPNYLIDDFFLLDESLIYLYKKPSGEWKANGEYCFVRPFKKKNPLNSVIEEVPLRGVMVYSNKINKDSLVGFLPDCEYSFEIDGEILYRMINSNTYLIK